jgi:hypothetical protein
MQDKVIDRCRVAQRQWEVKAEELIHIAFTVWLLYQLRHEVAVKVSQEPLERDAWRNLPRELRRAFFRDIVSKVKFVAIVKDGAVTETAMTDSVAFGYSIFCRKRPLSDGECHDVMQYVVPLWTHLVRNSPVPKWITAMPPQDQWQTTPQTERLLRAAKELRGKK